MKKKGFTLIELLVVIAIIAMLLAILMPALGKVKKLAARVVCGTNLKGLGNAIMIYSNDYDGAYPEQGAGAVSYNGIPGTVTTWHTVGAQTASWQIKDKVWDDESASTNGGISIGATLYLLVREADTSPKQFVCRGGEEKKYDGANSNNLDIVELWDFGHTGFNATTGPVNCVSYATHFPYGKWKIDDTTPAAAALMADRNPFCDDTLTNGATADTWRTRRGILVKDWDNTSVEKWEILQNNSAAHDREGQNVLFNDGHSSFEKRADVGISSDNIYTVNSGDEVDDKRMGDAPSSYGKVDPYGRNDCVLINDAKS